MSFSFNFAAIDLNKDHDIQSNEVAKKKDQEEKSTNNKEQKSSKGKASSSSSSGKAEQHALDTLIKSLPSKLSYTRVEVPIPQSDKTFSIYRRDLFDARFQMLHEDDEEGEDESSEEWKKFIAGSATDLVPGVYEGGLKTWECSLDLAAVLAQRIAGSSEEFLQNKKVIELGCGTAVPSLFLFSQAINAGDNQPKRLTLQLCDFNEQVLRMVSVNRIVEHSPSILTRIFLPF